MSNFIFCMGVLIFAQGLQILAQGPILNQKTPKKWYISPTCPGLIHKFRYWPMGFISGFYGTEFKKLFYLDGKLIAGKMVSILKNRTT